MTKAKQKVVADKANEKSQAESKQQSNIIEMVPSKWQLSELPDDFKQIVLNYCLIAVTLVLIAPFLKQLLYENSKQWMRQLAPYKQPWLSEIN